MITTTLAPYLKATLVADSLSLGPHWVYNQDKLARSYPDGVISLTPPLSQYHGSKVAGDFTHFGDQMLWLSESIAQSDGYNASEWKSYWEKRMSAYSGYIDSASKESLAKSSPSSSNDLSGASRIAPLLDLNLDLNTTIEYARSQTQLTHGDLSVVEAAEFFTRAAFALKAGSGSYEALQIAAEAGKYQALRPLVHLAAAQEANANDHLSVATSMGLTCHLPEAFPLTLYYAIHHSSNFSECISLNALAGGDTSARAMLLALLFAARDGGDEATINQLAQQLNIPESSEEINAAPKLDFSPGSHSVNFAGPNGTLAGIIEIPDLPREEISACAIFAHCFTCGKDYLPEKKITQALAKNGIATLRVDFSGLGSSTGAFEDSSFLTNVEDIYAAAQWLKENYQAPGLLVGHSLGGTAILAAAGNIPEVQAMATIGSPADPSHILHMIEEHIAEIEEKGSADVSLAGRNFTIGKQFIDDLKKYDYISNLNSLEGHKLIMHSPIDETVELQNAREVYKQLRHPKSFISLADSDHLLTKSVDATFAADMIATWAKKVIKAV